MSKSIWHTADQKPEPDARRWIYEKPSPTFPYGVSYRHTITAGWSVRADWVYVDDLIAQADKAERLQKAVDFLSGHLRDVLQLDEYGHIKLDEITKQQIKTAISDPVGIIMQLEQESNN